MKAACMPGQHPRHSTLVDVADQAAPAGALEKHLLQHAVLDHRGARFVGARVDQDLSAHRRRRGDRGRQSGTPADLSSSAVSIQRQPHDARIAAAQIRDEHGTVSLNGVAARLVARLPGIPIVARLRAHRWRGR